MGFCGRCGDIVHDTRCKKCGGSVVAPAVRWNNQPGTISDRWSKSVEATTSKPPQSITPLPKPTTEPKQISRRPDHLQKISTNNSINRFSTLPTTPTTRSGLEEGVRAHITRATSIRTPSPTKLTSTPLNPDSPDPSIVLSQDGGSLAKVYGSVLQPASTLASFVCSECETAFPPDATIYPSLTNSKEYYCRDCFIANGGSRGLCANPSCGREVLRFKAEGGFVENSGKVWHKRCFKCTGCQREVGHKPMVDLLGRPCCDDCFDTCLERGTGTVDTNPHSSPASKAVPRTQRTPLTKAPSTSTPTTRNNPGGLLSSPTRDGEQTHSPVVEELARRIGAPSPLRSREVSPIRPGSSPSPTRGTRGMDDVTSPLNRTLGAKLAALGGDVSPSPSGESSPKRFSAISFGSPSHSPSRLSHSVSSSTLGSSRASNSSPSANASPIPKESALPDDEDTKVTEDTEQTPTKPAAPSGLLTPGATPTGSPAATAKRPTKTPPASLSKIPRSSLTGRDSLDQTSVVHRSPSTQSLQPSSPAPTRIPSYSSPSSKASTSSPRVISTPIRSNTTKEGGLQNSTSTSSPSGQTKIKPRSSRLPVTSSKDRNALCDKCLLPLFSLDGSGRIVTVPNPGAGDGKEDSYHVECFRCDACFEPFSETEGAASFVRYEGGVRHVECAPTKVVKTWFMKDRPAPREREPPTEPHKPNPSRSPMKRPMSMYSGLGSSASFSNIPSPLKTHSATGSLSSSTNDGSAPRTPIFGSSAFCPGCRLNVSPMERGIVPGPAASKWHAPCLVCGGKAKRDRDRKGLQRGEKHDTKPGCGKKLDSGAKFSGDVMDGLVWCRDCFDLVRGQNQQGSSVASTEPIFPPRPKSSLGIASSAAIAKQLSRGSGASSPVRRAFQFPPPALAEGEVVDNFEDDATTPQGRTSPVRRNYNTTSADNAIRRQLTGSKATGDDRPLAIQYTGEGVPVTRQLSTRRPRSVLGMSHRSYGNGKSIDEGRGMFLVKQMTGQSSISGNGDS
ncbi:hypothetical protein FRC02_009984 [Tulasnella sp. 418]|nr:hypothetical protein FRC02_009984 [Tulasnella sp. 418]